MKLLSIITVTYNSQDTVQKTIESILPHIDNETEFIIIDGGSTDNTIEILNRYKRFITYFASEKDNGPFDAMNKGIRKAQGKYVSFMNSNDWFFKDALINMKRELASCNADIIYGDTHLYMDGDWSGLSKARATIKGYPIYSIPFCHQSSFTKRSTLLELNCYDNSYKRMADYDFLVRLTKKSNYELVKTNQVIACYSLGGISSAYRFSSKERLSIHRKYGFSPLKAYLLYLKWNFTGFIRSLLTPRLERSVRKIMN